MGKILRSKFCYSEWHSFLFTSTNKAKVMLLFLPSVIRPFYLWAELRKT